MKVKQNHMNQDDYFRQREECEEQHNSMDSSCKNSVICSKNAPVPHGVFAHKNLQGTIPLKGLSQQMLKC